MVNSRKRLDKIIKFWISILTLVLVFGVIGLCISFITKEKNSFCWIYQGNFPYISKVYRITSAFHNPLALANYLIVSFGLVISEFLLTEDKKYKNFLKAILFFIWFVALFTISREILSLMVATFLIYNYFCKKRDLRFKIIKFTSVALIIFIFVFIILFCSTFYVRSFKIHDLNEISSKETPVEIKYAYSTKFAYKIAALEMLKRHPFRGVGLKMFRSYLHKLNAENYFYNIKIVPLYAYAVSHQLSVSARINDPHNDFLQYFAETGLFGGLAFIFFISSFLYIISLNLRKINSKYFKVRLFCFFSAFIGILVESIDIDVFKLRPVWFLMAIILALIKIYEIESKDSLSN